MWAVSAGTEASSGLGVQGPTGQLRGAGSTLGGNHVWKSSCHIWIRLALSRLKISNKEGLLVLANLLQTDPARTASKGPSPSGGEGPVPKAVVASSRDQVDCVCQNLLPAMGAE